MKLSFKKYALEIVVGFLVLLRMVVAAWLPLLDKTEARYAEIARIMYDTGNWVTPQIDYGVPFWAKPPMSTWISALSFHVFGVNEFAARFPSLLIHVLLIVFLNKALKLSKSQGLLLAFVLLTLPEYYIHTGVVSTDSSLLVGITFVMIGFWQSLHASHKKRMWQLLTWLGVAIGMLSKGPIALVLTVPPVFVWSCFYKRQLLEFFKKAFWIPGLVLAFAISFLWYYLAELKTPGFIDYFFVGEHYKRFVESGWKGDKYGFAKQQPLGMVWVFLLLFSMPWFQFVAIKAVKYKTAIVKNPWVLFLWLWALWVPFFFTISKSLIHTYTLPCTIPIALLVLHYFNSFKQHKTWIGVAMVVPVLVFLGYIVTHTVYTDTQWQNTDKHLLEITYNQPTKAVYAWKFKSYSSQFYSKGKIELVKKEEKLVPIFNGKKSFYLLSKNSNFNSLPQRFKEQLIEVGQNKKSKLYQYNP